MKEKKRLHIFFYWIFMIILFVGVLYGQQLVASMMQGSLSTSKFGREATFEILWAGLVLLVVLLFKNKYIFTQERQGFFESFQYILPELLLSGFFVFISIVALIINGNPLDKYAVFNLALYCLFIGIVEEFLCRGWLLNEFLERYSKTKKEVLLSILCSSFIFGVVHFINIGETRGFFETLVQVMNAFAGGVFLALVYYKTKNIWVVVWTHAVWDFTLFLSQTNSLGDCLAAAPTTLSIALNIVRGLVLILAYSLFCLWIYRQTDIYEKEKKSNMDWLIGVGVALYIVGLLFIQSPSTDTSLCPNYGRKKIESSYEVSYFQYDHYALEKDPIALEIDPDTGAVLLKNTDTNESVFLTDDDEYREFLLIENRTNFVIMLQTSWNVVYYGKFDKDSIQGDKVYLEKIRDSLNRTVVPNVVTLGTIELENKDYRYPLMKTELGEYLYFDQSGKLYLDAE